MMTKWDTIQADVADAYIGIEENLAWEDAITSGDISLDVMEEDELTLDWNE
jgi:hypothetical protein